MTFVRDNGGMLAVLGVMLVVLGAFADWRISVKVEEALGDKGFATSDKITEIEEDLADQKVVHKEDRDRMDGKIERIVDILLEQVEICFGFRAFYISSMCLNVCLMQASWSGNWSSFSNSQIQNSRCYT